MGSGETTTKDNTGEDAELDEGSISKQHSSINGLVSCMHNYHQEKTKDAKESGNMGVDDWMFDTVEEKKDEKSDSDPFDALNGEDEESIPSERSRPGEEDVQNLSDFMTKMDDWINHN